MYIHNESGFDKTNDKNNFRVPLFDEKNKTSITVDVKREDGNKEIDYFALHRLENNDWNGNVNIYI